MLLCVSQGKLLAIPQHDHGLLAGVLARYWNFTPLSPWLELAISFHDYGWVRFDQTPLWDKQSGRPYDFLTYPTPARLFLYQKAAEEAEKIHPFVSYMTSWHYTSFLALSHHRDFQQEEKKRRERLYQRLSPSLQRLAQSKETLFYLKFFDNLSLYLCLAFPLVDSFPDWLSPAYVGQSPSGHTFKIEWLGNDKVRFSPFPFEKEFSYSLPVFLFSRCHWSSEQEWLKEWGEKKVFWREIQVVS